MVASVVATTPGVLNNGQQALELVESGDLFFSEIVPEGSPVLDFIQPSVTFNPADELSPLPAAPTGRVFDATDGGLPWRLRWANSRVPLDFFETQTQVQEDVLNALLRSFGAPPVDLVYIGDPQPLPGPAPTAETFEGAVLNITANTVVDLGFDTVNGVTTDTHDSLGVFGLDRLALEPGFEAAVPSEGVQAFLADDTDGALLLELDPIDASRFTGLTLRFDLAVGATGFEGPDRFAVLVNGRVAFELTPPAEEGTPNGFDAFSPVFSAVEVPLPAFANQGDVRFTFLFDSSAEAETIAIDNIRLTGVEVGDRLAGDFNADGLVNAADYTLWRDSLDRVVPAGTAADGDGDGLIGVGDYGVWAARYGSTALGGSLAVPEPHAGVVAIAAVLATLMATRGAIAPR